MNFGEMSPRFFMQTPRSLAKFLQLIGTAPRFTSEDSDFERVVPGGTHALSGWLSNAFVQMGRQPFHIPTGPAQGCETLDFGRRWAPEHPTPCSSREPPRKQRGVITQSNGLV